MEKEEYMRQVNELIGEGMFPEEAHFQVLTNELEKAHFQVLANEHEERCLEILAGRVYELEWGNGYPNNGEIEIIAGSELRPPLWNNINFCYIAELKPYETYTYRDPGQTVKITRIGEGVPRV